MEVRTRDKISLNKLREALVTRPVQFETSNPITLPTATKRYIEVALPDLVTVAAGHVSASKNGEASTAHANITSPSRMRNLLRRMQRDSASQGHDIDGGRTA